MKLIKAIVSAIVTTIRTNRLPRNLAEPIRVVANKVIGATALVTGALAFAQAHVNLVPAKYRSVVSGALVAVGVVFAFVVKVSSEIMRSKVFSPATVAAMAPEARQADAAPAADPRYT